MAVILHIETATNICSVALSDNEKLLSLRESVKINTHSELTTVFISEVLSESKTNIKNIDAVAVSIGPGSYTGLRIGVSVAKGLCYALDIPLIGIGTLVSMAYGAKQLIPETDNSFLFCPMLDARRMEVYYALYNNNFKEFITPSAEIMDQNSFANILLSHHLLFFGDGMEKCRLLFDKIPNVTFLDNFFPSAKYMLTPAIEKFKEKDFENVAYFEPFYLKDFVAGLPNVKGLK